MSKRHPGKKQRRAKKQRNKHKRAQQRQTNRQAVTQQQKQDAPHSDTRPPRSRDKNVLQVSNMIVDGPTRRLIDGVSLSVGSGEIVAILGPNGAGKSELVLGIAGVLSATGDIHLGEKSLSGLTPEQIRSAGVAAVPEGHQTLSGLSVSDNLRAAGPQLGNSELVDAVDTALTVFPELKLLQNRTAGQLSGGQQQMLALAQALVSQPKILLIDEMSLGLAPVIIERLTEVVSSLRDQGYGILLIEQFTHLALSLADQCHVMSRGKLQFSGTPQALQKNRSVLEKAYLG